MKEAIRRLGMRITKSMYFWVINLWPEIEMSEKEKESLKEVNRRLKKHGVI